MNIFDITANRIRQVKDGAVNDIEDLYASKSDIQTVLDSKADQADTYTKEQINANFYDITETYDKTEINVLSNNISSNSFLIGNLTITSNTNFNNISLNTSLINNLNSTMTTNFNNISSNTNSINTNLNNISLNTSLIYNLNSTMTTNFNNISSNTNSINTNFNNISSNTNLINNLNSTVSTNFNNISSNSHLISQLQTGSFDSNLYYNKITTNNLLTDKLNTSVLNNTLIHNITTTSIFKIANFGNYNNFFEMYNNYFDCYVYGNLSGATMFLNQRGFGDVEINNSSIVQNDKILLNHNTTILSNLQVSGLFSCSSILDITGSDSRYVLQSDNLAGLITGNTNTINSIITSNNSQDTSLGQKLDKIDTNAQSVAGAINFSDNTTLHSNLNMLTTGSIICTKFSTTSSPNVGLQMTFQMFNREFNINRDGRMWMSSSGGQWETQIGDANVGRVWVKDRFGLGAVGVNGYVLNCAGKSRFTDAVDFIGTDKAVNLNNGSYLNFNNNGSIRRYTPSSIEGLYMSHNDFVSISIGDVTNASNQYMMCDGLVNKTIFSKPIDVLGNIYTNADVNCDNINIDTDGKLTIDTNCELYRYVSAFSSFDMRNSDANSSIRFICGDPAVQSNIVGAVNISTGWTFNTSTVDVMGNLFADDVYVKTNGALRSNHIAPNGGTLVTVDTNLAVQNAYLATNTIQSFDLTTVSFLNNISMTTGTDIKMGTSEISTYHDGTNLSTIDVIFRTSNTAFRVSDASSTPSVLLSIDKTFGATINTGSFTNNALSTFNENVTVAGTKKMLCNLIEPSTGTNIDLTATTVTINGTFVDSSDSRLKYDIDNIKSNCMNVIKKFKPKKFKRHDRNDGGKTHIGYIADEVLKAIPKEFENVVSKDREYLGLNYLVLPVLVHKAVLELNDKVDKLEKEIKEFKKEKNK